MLDFPEVSQRAMDLGREVVPVDYRSRVLSDGPSSGLGFAIGLHLAILKLRNKARP